jgi:biopolymer transport protein ExbD
MGMSTGGKPGGLQSDINVTPLIDVLLVLLIIFLVVMPIMMKMETLQVPRKLNNEIEMPDPNSSQLTIKVDKALQVSFNDGSSENDTPIQAVDIAKTLRPKLEAMNAANDKVVFVQFDDEVPWNEVVTTMDTVRSLASDVNHDEIKVALKVKPEDQGK